MRTDVVLLPGLHGSTALFDSFIALAPAWARCRAMALPTEGSQSFDALAAALEPELRSLEGFVLFGESFSGPVAARLATRLGSKVSLLVLCNPLVEPPIGVAASLVSSFARSRLMPRWPVAFAMTGSNRDLAAAILREVRALPGDVFAHRLAVASSARREDLLEHLVAPVLVIAGTSDRLLPARVIEDVLERVPFSVFAQIDAPHLAAQVAPAAVWAAITGEFERAA
jgi:pimeloyl-[acyl-carrier protein] methyl ester esterase